MAALVKKEDGTSFDFCLESFLHFGFSLPDTVITDQDPALKTSLKKWSSKHLYCVYHIYRNIEKNLASLLGNKNKEFLRDFARIQRIEDEDIFEKEWEILLKTYGSEPKRSTNNDEAIEYNSDVEENVSDMENETNLLVETGKIIPFFFLY